MARKNKVNVGNNGEFRHGVSIGENGEILYDAPIIIEDKADMENYGITKDDCKFVHLGGEKKRVYYYPTPSRELAEFHWKELNKLHHVSVSNGLCVVPGKQKAFVKCRDTNKCAECPYGITPETKKAAVISWDELTKYGYECEADMYVEEQIVARDLYRRIRGCMEAEDPRIPVALEAKVLGGESVKRIAVKLKVTESRVYQLISRAKAIGKQYRKENHDE